MLHKFANSIVAGRMLGLLLHSSLTGQSPFCHVSLLLNYHRILMFLRQIIKQYILAILKLRTQNNNNKYAEKIII